MNKITKIILGILVGLVVVVGVLIVLNIATFKAFIWQTSTIVTVHNQTGNVENTEVKYNQDSWKEIIPESCQTFNDGCNTCMKSENGEPACTMMACEEYSEPKCLDDEVKQNEAENETTEESGVKNTENVPTCDENSDGLTQCAVVPEGEIEGIETELPENPITILPRDEAKKFIIEGKATSVAQSHDLTVNFSDVEWNTYTTTEPEIDGIFDVIKQCGEICKDIPVMTE